MPFLARPSIANSLSSTAMPKLRPLSGGLAPTGHEVDELVAEKDEGRPLTLGRYFEIEEAAVEIQRLLDVAGLQRDMVDADGLCPGLRRLCHAVPRIQSGCRPSATGPNPEMGAVGRATRSGGACPAPIGQHRSKLPARRLRPWLQRFPEICRAARRRID